jgi:hypothetical protein
VDLKVIGCDIVDWINWLRIQSIEHGNAFSGYIKNFYHMSKN